jgi:hypothetical protein
MNAWVNTVMIMTSGSAPSVTTAVAVEVPPLIVWVWVRVFVTNVVVTYPSSPALAVAVPAVEVELLDPELDGSEEPSPATTSTSMHDVYNSRYEGSTAVSLVKSQTQ